MLSLKRLYPGVNLTLLQSEFESSVKAEEKNLIPNQNNIAIAGKELSHKEKFSQNMVIKRKRLGFPCSLARIPCGERIEHPAGIEEILNWADGKRDLFEILKLFKYDTGKILTEKELSYLIRYLSLLDKYGYIKIRHKVKVASREIKGGLRKLGIKQGDKVMVHFSFSSLGYVIDGVEAVCNTLMELITDKGVLLMPSFNHYTVFEKETIGYYSPSETPTTNGIVADTFWRMRGVFRSLNPSHAFAVWGKNARDYVKNHHKCLTMGEGSPLHLLEKAEGKVVMVDCPGANTFHHVVEMTNNVPCLGKRTEEYQGKLPDGRMVRCRTWGWRDGTCPITDKGLYMKTMKEKKLIKEGKIGNANVLVFGMKDCRKVIEKFLRGEKGCKYCNIKPRVVPQTVESDWGNKNRRVNHNTTAFIGDWNL